MSYRNDLEALAARHDALAVEVSQKTRELDAAKHLLDEAKQRAKLPVLPNIRVASPCRADWNKMTKLDGDDRVRACADCNKNVYNLSEMTRDEAEALILAKEGRLCVRYYQRHDGTILLKDCEIGVVAKRKRRLIAAGAAVLLAGGGAAAYKGTRPTSQSALPDVDVVSVGESTSMAVRGGAALPPPPPVVEEPKQPEHHLEVVKGKLEPMMGDVFIEDHD
jgi:hypothetical protein